MIDGLTKTADVQGKRVTGLGDARLGTVRELFVDLAAGAITFVVVEGVSLLGGSGKFHPVPWSALRYDALGDRFRVEIDKDHFKDSPSYDRDQLANASTGWNEQAMRFFSSLQRATSVGQR